jgi:hypothetical protein
VFEARVVVHGHADAGTLRRLHAPLGLLHYVPRFVRQMPTLAWSEMDVAAGGIGERLESLWRRRVMVHADVPQREARLGLEATTKRLRKRGRRAGRRALVFRRAEVRRIAEQLT